MKVLLPSVLIMLLQSCTTIKYVYKSPKYEPPVFPKLESIEVQGDSVAVPAEWFISVGKFKNEYVEFCEMLNKAAELGESE